MTKYRKFAGQVIRNRYIGRMQIRKNAIYALEICGVLSGADGPMSLVEIGLAIGLEPGGVQQAIIPLLRERIVVSRRGRQSGYTLQRKRLNAWTVVSAFGDGVCAPVAGDSKRQAAIRRKIRSSIERALKGMKLADL